MLDGHENTLEVAAKQRGSPAKQSGLDSFVAVKQRGSPAKQNGPSFVAVEQRGSPAKQRTLDSFIKRCNQVNDSEHQPELKYQRH